MQLDVPRFDSAQILVVGDVMLDRYWHGDAARISPEAPVPVVRVDHKEDRPGGAANVALNIAALGAGVSLAGIIGRDDAGATLKTSLEGARVHCAFLEATDAPTITKLRVISRNQQLIRLDFEQIFSGDYAAPIADAVRRLISDVSVLVLSDYSKGTLADCRELIGIAKSHGKLVVVDPKGGDFERYRGASLLTPNLAEFEAAAGAFATEDELIEKAQALAERLEIEALLITRSEAGMTLVRPGQGALHYPARAREVYDVTGAGDTVVSTLAVALASGQDLQQAAGLANVAAGIVVAKLGTAAISAPELRRALIREKGYLRGVMSQEQLLLALEDARAAGQRIVFTNGCFDILHAGHVGYLDQARALGDRLVVAVNSDASVRRLKGAARPINPVDRRLTVLAGLEAVDWAVEFEDDTPIPLLEKIRPDVLVKGGDYSIDGVVGGELVAAYGGEVRVLAHLDDCSTTAIVDQLQESGDG